MGALTDKAIDLVDSNDAAVSGTPTYRAAGVPGSPFAVDLDGLAAYTVEMVLRPASAGATRIIFDARDGGSDGLQMLITSANLVSANHNKKKDPF